MVAPLGTRFQIQGLSGPVKEPPHRLLRATRAWPSRSSRAAPQGCHSLMCPWLLVYQVFEDFLYEYIHDLLIVLNSVRSVQGSGMPARPHHAMKVGPNLSTSPLSLLLSFRGVQGVVPDQHPLNDPNPWELWSVCSCFVNSNRVL